MTQITIAESARTLMIYVASVKEEGMLRPPANSKSSPLRRLTVLDPRDLPTFLPVQRRPTMRPAQELALRVEVVLKSFMYV